MKEKYPCKDESINVEEVVIGSSTLPYEEGIDRTKLNTGAWEHFNGRELQGSSIPVLRPIITQLPLSHYKRNVSGDLY